jgi:hypothetical protein
MGVRGTRKRAAGRPEERAVAAGEVECVCIYCVVVEFIEEECDKK